MMSFLKAIILFSANGSKRVVPLKPGVNIITGDSKTGKSALVEIIDYCLCSSHCSIPKGKITDFASLYCILLQIQQNVYVVARQSMQNDGKMYLCKEDVQFSEDALSLSYFDEVPVCQVKEVQLKIESALGMSVTNVNVGDDLSRKPSLRNMVSYLFQHQNLMASKFALFYRFTDFAKRKDVIEQFPVFAGILGQEYYSDLIHLEFLKGQLRNLRNTQTRNKKSVEYVRNNLAPLIKNYYSLLGKEFLEPDTIKELMQFAARLPEFDDSGLSHEEGIVKRYHDLHRELEEKRNDKRKLLMLLESIESAGTSGQKYTDMLITLREQTEFSQPQSDSCVCPLCGAACDTLAQSDQEVKQASDWLNDELTLTEKYTHDFSEDVRKTREQLADIQQSINTLLSQIRTIERKYIQSNDLVTKREKANYAKSEIKLYLDTSKAFEDDDLSSDINKLQDEIDRLNTKIDGFDVHTKLNRAQSFLDNNMRRLAVHLDFEDEYRPVDLNFTLVDKTYDLYHLQHGREKIYLFEMGSGANWVSCHIALFLSFLRYFASQENSPMPLIMFFDQPSQVYFPQGLTEETSHDNEHSMSDLIAVNEIYKTIFDEIESIHQDTGILPQIIIVDHVSVDVLDEKERFKKALRRDWRNRKGLI